MDFSKLFDDDDEDEDKFVTTMTDAYVTNLSNKGYMVIVVSESDSQKIPEQVSFDADVIIIDGKITKNRHGTLEI